MRILILILSLFSVAAWSQDPVAYLNSTDTKVYSLKTKGVKDFVVDIESSKLTKQVNDQMIFGKVNELIFRTYWTNNPERISVEVIGLPEGFREVKEELKMAMMSLMDNLIPIPMVSRFAGYKFHSSSVPKEFIAQDSTGIASVPSYVLKFDIQDKLVSITGKKPVGTLVSTPKYEKDSFADGKWVLKSFLTESSENGQTMTIRKDLSYGTSQGVGVLTSVAITTEQKFDKPNSKSMIIQDSVEFKNYKINTGEALKYFLGESPKD